jgi:hypothetical protein
VRTDQEITAEIQAARPHFQPGFYAWLAVLLSAITLPVLSMVVALSLGQHATERAISQERSARRATELAMCVVVTTFTDAYKNEPPTTAAGREVAEGMAGLRLAYHCDER